MISIKKDYHKGLTHLDKSEKSHETNHTHIQIRGARQNNLKNINVNISYGKITVASDIQDLLIMLRKIADAGNTIIIVEHNINMIRNSNWIIDLDPEGGEHGEYLVAQGTPTDIIDNKDSYTGQEMIKK